MPITFPEAALGADIKVPTLDGGSVTVRIPPGTRSGRTLRVKGKEEPVRAYILRRIARQSSRS